MVKDKLFTPGFCYILAANFLLFFAFYLLLPVLPSFVLCSGLSLCAAFFWVYAGYF